MACDHILSTLVSIDRKSVFYSIILFPAPQKTINKINKIYLQTDNFPFVYSSRWSPAFKELCRSSRLETTRQLATAVRLAPDASKPKVRFKTACNS